MKIVFDTNVWISAMLWNRSVANKLFKLLLEHEVSIYTSYELLVECKKVLERDFPESNMKEILNELLESSVYIQVYDKVDVVANDKSDNIIIECALAASADFIISYDKHLLNIVEYRNIRVITPERALRLLSLFF